MRERPCISSIKSSNLISARQTYLLGIQDDLGELTGLCKALDDFVGDIGPQVDAESQSGVHRLHQVAQLLRALQLKRRTTNISFGLWGEKSVSIFIYIYYLYKYLLWFVGCITCT